MLNTQDEVLMLDYKTVEIKFNTGATQSITVPAKWVEEFIQDLLKRSDIAKVEKQD